MSAPEFATLTSDDLVTGEAVALDLPPAGLGVRLVSGIIDVAVTLVLLVVTFLVFMIAASRADGALLHVAVVGLIVVVFLVYPTAVETLTRGRSVGKLAMGLRTVRDDAGPITAQHAFVRALIAVVEIWSFTAAPAVLSAMVSGRGKRLGDYAAGTYVVRERVRLRLAAPPQMPGPLAGWARSADITSLPTGLALAVRQYLGRLPHLDPASRQRVGVDLATRVSAYVAPPPPPGTPPDAFLAAVVVARRERDARRLAAEAAQRRRLTGRR